MKTNRMARAWEIYRSMFPTQTYRANLNQRLRFCLREERLERTRKGDDLFERMSTFYAGRPGEQAGRAWE